MSPQLQVHAPGVQSLKDLLKEVEETVQSERVQTNFDQLNIKDLRWQFDQVSAKMNQAIYNDHKNKIHEACLKTITILVEILARS